PLEIRIEYVKAFQELNRAYESLVTYDDYNDDMVQSSTLNNQIQLLEEQIGVYKTVKGSLMEEEPEKEGEDFSTIEFYSENTTKLYDIDSTYI
ncbi:type I restriction endonuclease subunit R, partial [Enterococcus faecium]|nr:type I restriction endonuclease subunit R [Enterococcus faecium]